jgi:hypothetical protein
VQRREPRGLGVRFPPRLLFVPPEDVDVAHYRSRPGVAWCFRVRLVSSAETRAQFGPILASLPSTFLAAPPPL